MKPPNTIQKGAFFGVLAICLMLVLTVMAINAAEQRPAPFTRLHHYETAQSPQPMAADHGR
jgi:hypothetical protein